MALLVLAKGMPCDLFQLHLTSTYHEDTVNNTLFPKIIAIISTYCNK
jgi:hypothetical protein